MSFALKSGEKLVFDLWARNFPFWLLGLGKFRVTDQRLVFSPWFFGIRFQSIEIPFTELADIGPVVVKDWTGQELRLPAGIYADIALQTFGGKDYRFHLYSIDPLKVTTIIRSLLNQPTVEPEIMPRTGLR